MYEAVYTIEVKLSYADRGGAEGTIRNLDVADAVREVFYDLTDRYYEQITCNVSRVIVEKK